MTFTSKAFKLTVLRSKKVHVALCRSIQASHPAFRMSHVIRMTPKVYFYQLHCIVVKVFLMCFLYFGKNNHISQEFVEKFFKMFFLSKMFEQNFCRKTFLSNTRTKVKKKIRKRQK